MATYFFETLTAARSLAMTGNHCFASDGADEPGAAGGGESDLGEVTIVRGTVRTGGYDKATGSYDTEEHGPGATIHVTARERDGLIARGQVADPHAEPAPVGEGPMFTAPPVAPKAEPAKASPKPRKR